MACQSEKLNVEFLEALLDFANKAIGDLREKEHAAHEKVINDCVSSHFPDEFFISDQCKETLREANEIYERLLDAWLQSMQVYETLKEAQNAYNNCLHKQRGGHADG